MPRQGWTAHAYMLTERDAARLEAVIGAQSVNQWLRGLVNDELERLGLPVLEEAERGRGRPRKDAA